MSITTASVIDFSMRQVTQLGNSTFVVKDFISDSQSTFVGYNAGTRTTTSGDNNCFIGAYSGQFNTDGDNNCCVGLYSGSANIAGSNNVMIGYRAGFTATSAQFQTIIGTNAGSTNASNLTGCIMIGASAGNSAITSNTMWLTPSLRSDYTNSTGANSMLCYNGTTGRVTPMPFVIKTIEQTFSYTNFTGAAGNVTAAFTTQLPANSTVIRTALTGVTGFTGDGAVVFRVTSSGSAVGNNTALGAGYIASAVVATHGNVTANISALDLGGSTSNMALTNTTIIATLCFAVGVTYSNVTAGAATVKVTYITYN